jgi:RNA polymerase sigma factor (sigma-70 family)
MPTNNHADHLLMERLKKGDLDAFEQLFKLYYKPLVAEAYYLLKDETEAQDQVQLLFVELWDKKLYRNLNADVRLYLHRAIKNKCLNLLKKNKTKENRLAAYARTVQDRINGDVAEVNETSRRVNAILGELPAQRLKAVSLVYMEDKKYQDAAEEMGITINSIKTHLKLAMKTLQQKLKDI